MPEPAVPRKSPCASCPYRRDVPSGVWAAEEYEKLPGFDGDTAVQSPATFYCHQQDGAVCAGWLGHTEPSELLGVRVGLLTGALDESCLDYRTDVALFASGAEAAAHGLRDLDTPGDSARDTMRKITRTRSTPMTKTFRYPVTTHGGLRDLGITTRMAVLLVEAPSQVKAVEAMQAVGWPSLHVKTLRDYGGRTGNAHEEEIAGREPGVVFAIPAEGEGPDHDYDVVVPLRARVR